jgi:hypothetical protein
MGSLSTCTTCWENSIVPSERETRARLLHYHQLQIPSTPLRNLTVMADHSLCSFQTRPLHPTGLMGQRHHCWELESVDCQSPSRSAQALAQHFAWRRNPGCSAGLGKTCFWIASQKASSSRSAWVWPPRCLRFREPLELSVRDLSDEGGDELTSECKSRRDFPPL